MGHEEQADKSADKSADQAKSWRSADFFISRAGNDKEFAIWLAALIKACGKTCILQDKDFGHQDFTDAMDRALKSDARMVAIYSPDYLASDNCLKEANTALAGDPFNRRQKLITLRLIPCTPEGMLANIAFTDLIPDRRLGDADALIVKILTALGLDATNYAAMPRPPAGILNTQIQIMHSEFEAVLHFTGRQEDLEKLGNLL